MQKYGDKVNFYSVLRILVFDVFLAPYNSYFRTMACGPIVETPEGQTRLKMSLEVYGW